MTGWEKKIIDEFISHYFDSVPETGEGRSILRVRSSMLFPDFDASHSDEKESYLEAAEALQQKGIIKLNWEKRGRGERLKTLSCENFEKLFEETGSKYPKTEAEETRVMLGERVKSLKESLAMLSDNDQAKEIVAFLEFLSLHFSTREIRQGIDQHVMEEFIRLMEFCCGHVKQEKLTTRALSILLYRDSKYLENLLTLFIPLVSRVQKTIPVPDLSFLERSYPETMIAGKIVIQYKDRQPPLVNASGHILGLPLENAQAIETIQLVSEKKEKTVLTIENKETFYALGSPQKNSTSELLSRFDCFLYVGGYSNRAAAAMIKVLAKSNFTFYHAGDLDPDGILILQHVQELAGRPVTPLRMDAVAFDLYQNWARPLTKTMLDQIKKINDETRAVPELEGLLRRIEETGTGVEQEIIDYR
ncbi:MAG: DUF2220 domain-containing protein [Treponema sp.]|jgi:hypothetical protein|nr:DUF2220 domain-containing protein [Treponema sp.]